ncbi:MAG: hypothetical protein Roseis2KO_26930 [Roseivirga sp.]
MKEFPGGIAFKYPWRQYQQRVLNELDEHLEDNHLHVIAPPGSGKTVLGLEVMLRLNLPTLILAPTIAIRNQWVQRFCELFLQVDQRPDWISRDIKNPEFVTVATYQGLHATCSGETVLEDELEELEEDGAPEKSSDSPPKNTALQALLDSLKQEGITTIIVDEAHHLKNAWWKTLMAIKEGLQATIVGLTATPPYDVSYSEWQRYLELNGPVDTEISVPELVKEGDLCPHQDYLHFSHPTQTEIEKIEQHRANVQTVFNHFSRDEMLFEYLLQFPAIAKTELNHDWIYSNIEIYSSMLIFLVHNNAELDLHHFSLTGNKKANIPALDNYWLEVLLEFFLRAHTPEVLEVEAYQKQALKILRQHGAIQKNKITLTSDAKIESYLKSSLSKLDSIQEIAEFEYNNLGSDLRLVILGDFIRKEFLNDTVEINKMGVIPIFETLRRRLATSHKMGVLTGSLIIIPLTALPALERVAATYGISKVSAAPLPYDPDYLIIQPTEQIRHDLVHIITQVFESGEFHILIGTKSLLGEGWDAPSINALILASFIGSFVMSNQMRGRAIRTLKRDSEKTGNIWHLVCHDPTRTDGGNDLQVLERRFRGFVGISERDHKTIENGLARMVLPKKLNRAAIEDVNARMMVSAANRDVLRTEWNEAIKNGTILKEEIKIPFETKGKTYKQETQFQLKSTISYLIAELVFGLGLYSEGFLEFFAENAYIETFDDLLYWIYAFCGIGLLVFGRQLFKSARLYLKYRDISKDLDNIGKALLHSLLESKTIRRGNSLLRVETSVTDYGEIFCHLEGGTTYEKSTFIQALEEIVCPVDSPRYLIIRKSSLLKLLTQKDFHSVPEVLGKKKALATGFNRHWQKFVGKSELVFTRNPEGRAALLKARFNSLASEFKGKPERTNRWK